MSFPATVLSMARVCGLSLAAIVGSNAARGRGCLSGTSAACCKWGVQVVRYPNFFLGNGSR